MKRMLKKLTAIALAGAMALSLSVTALADTTAYDTEVTVNGAVTGPTQMPADVISVKMPTQSAAATTFNMWFDPNNLIRRSNNALNVGHDSTNTTVDVSAFDTDTLVYFKNSGDTLKFTKTSDDIEIINNGYVPIGVEMRATWTKGTSANGTISYTLSKDATEFDAANTAGEAALSLVLQDSKNNSDYVVEKEKSTPVMSWNAKTTPDATNGASTRAADVKAVEAAEETIKGLIKNITFEWLPAADAQDIKNINLGDGTNSHNPGTWTFTFGPGAKKTPTVTFTNVATEIPGYKTTNGSNVTTTPYASTASTAVTITEYKNTDDSYTYSLPNNTPNANGVVTIKRGTTEVAKITVEWDYEALGDLNKELAQTNYVVEYAKVGVDDTDSSAVKSSKVELEIKAAAGDGALVKADLNRVEGSYTMQEDTQNAGQLKWVKSSDFSDDSKFQSLKFNLTAAITDSEKAIAAWNDAYPNDVTGATVTVKWKVVSCAAVDPSAEVTTELASATDSATLKVDWGYGSKLASAITGGSFTAGNGSAGTLPASAFVVDETDNTVITVTPGSQGNALFAGDGKVTITFDTGATAVVALKAAE